MNVRIAARTEFRNVRALGGSDRSDTLDSESASVFGIVPKCHSLVTIRIPTR